MVRKNYDLKLDMLNQNIVDMWKIVQYMIRESVNALNRKNEVLAQTVIDRDDKVDDFQAEIEENCVRLLSMEQPLATDLRKVITSIKIVTDLERMADHAVDIAKTAKDIVHEDYIKELVDIPKMADIVLKIAEGSMEAYLSCDAGKAKEVCVLDDTIDDYYKIIFEDLVVIMKNNPSAIYQGSKFIFVIRLLERIADHATNICEEIVYLNTGVNVTLN